jgi:HEAT repeat protein
MNKEITQPFAAVLDSLFKSEQVPIHLLYRLSDLLPEELEQFAERWPDVDEERRRVIIRHLADICEDNYVVDFGPVFAFCFQDPAAAVRIAALDGLWDASDTSLIEPIIRLMQSDESLEVRTAATAALAHYVLMAEWGELPRQVSRPIVEALLAEYEKADTALPIKSAALEALGAANHPRIAQLIAEAYESEHPEMQLSAVFAMGSSADARWLTTVLAEMDSPIADMRAEAARAAGSIGSSDAIPALANLVVDEDLDVGLAAVTALGQIGGESASRILTALAEDPEYEDLHEAVDEALEEMDWLSGEFNLMTVAEDGEFGEDEFDEDELMDDED